MDSAGIVKEYWERMMVSITPYHENSISVALMQEEVAQGKPFDQVYLLLPFGGYERCLIGYAKHEGVRAYSADVLKQIKHQSGLRLEKLADKFIIDFSAKLFGIDRVPVTQSFCNSLKSPDLSDSMDIVKDSWIDEQLGGLSAVLKFLT